MASQTNSAKKGKDMKEKTLTKEEIVSEFNELRQQQRSIATKISELEMDCKEHELVVAALKHVDPERKCFRMVGGVLVERTVKDVLPALENNKDQLGKVIEGLTKQLETQGEELNEFREKHNIRIRGEEDEGAKKDEKKQSAQGVLVS
ncbi:prefoldin subunit 2-like [Lineus longissimus]|uniref:prefoldin subunit 2-like n=1 Tax=Lineus longissimus TaxID=88925 RepID=UPI002B4E07F9